jgi:hypothetical protein
MAAKVWLGKLWLGTKQALSFISEVDRDMSMHARIKLREHLTNPVVKVNKVFICSCSFMPPSQTHLRVNLMDPNNCQTSDGNGR